MILLSQERGNIKPSPTQKQNKQQNTPQVFENRLKHWTESNTTAPLKSKDDDITSDRTKQMEQRADHYQDLYSAKNIVTDSAFDKITNPPVIVELDLPPIVDELITWL